MDPGPAAGTDELVDVDGDGFPDLLHAETGAHGYQLVGFQHPAEAFVS